MPRRIYVPPDKMALPAVDPRRDVVVSIRATCCPKCGAAFDWVGRSDLSSIAILWRCRPGQHPLSFEFTCRSCDRRWLVVISRSGVFFQTEERARLLRSAARERTREAIEDAFLDDDVD